MLGVGGEVGVGVGVGGGGGGGGEGDCLNQNLNQQLLYPEPPLGHVSYP